MKITFSNLGTIRKTELDLRPLTVIIGPNKSSKTYLTCFNKVLGIFTNPFQALVNAIESTIQSKGKLRFKSTVLRGREIKVDVKRGLSIDLYNASSIKQLTSTGSKTSSTGACSAFSRTCWCSAPRPAAAFRRRAASRFISARR